MSNTHNTTHGKIVSFLLRLLLPLGARGGWAVLVQLCIGFIIGWCIGFVFLGYTGRKDEAVMPAICAILYVVIVQILAYIYTKKNERR